MRHFIYRLIMLFGILVTLEAGVYQAIEKFDNPDGTQRIRVYFDYLGDHTVTKRLRGAEGGFSLNFPIPNKWELLDVSGYIKYTSSLLMLGEHSSGTIFLNDVIIDQFKLFERTKIGSKFTIDPLLFGDYNTFMFQAIQHYTLECEDPASNELWTDVDLRKSYIDFLVRLKPAGERIASINTVLFDQKQYTVTPLNYVINDTNESVLKNYALFTATASSRLKYRAERIEVSSTLDNAMHNIIIAPKDEAKHLLKGLGDYYIFNENPSLSLQFDSQDSKLSLGIGQQDKNSSSKNFVITSAENRSGNYAHFEGGKLTLPKTLGGNEKEKTIAFWMRSDRQDGKKFLFGTEQYALVLSDSSIGFSTGEDNLFGANIALEDNAWHYIVARLSGQAIKDNKLAVDGRSVQLEQLEGVTDLLGTKTGGVYTIAALQVDDAQAFYGDIDQFYLFDRPVSDAFGQKLYRVASSQREKGINGALFIDEKIAHDINVIQNPHQIENAIIVIAPTQKEEIEKCISALYKDDLIFYNQAGLDINKSSIPAPAKPYTAKRFLPLGKKIYFKELGYTTTLLRGQYPPKVNLDFKVYPDNYFDSKDKMKLGLHFVFPSVVRFDSAANIYLNKNFAKQIDIKGNSGESEITVEAKNLFDWDSLVDMPAYLIGQGYNSLLFDFSLIPEKRNHCETFNTRNLVATLLDDSYFIIPKADQWIELPYLQLIPNASYPYSIYPDLQQTTILLANKGLSTIAASMNFIFYLTQQIDSYPYYLHMTYALDTKAKASHIVAFGTTGDELMQEMSQGAPLAINKETVDRSYPFIQKFVEHKGILEKDRTQKYRFANKMTEGKQANKNLVLQMMRSPYDKQKTVVMVIADNDRCLNDGVFSILQDKNLGKIKGDLVIYNHGSEIAKSFNVKGKYIISDLNWIDTISLMVGNNPLLYIAIVFFVLVLITMILRRFLLKFKEEHHRDAE